MITIGIKVKEEETMDKGKGRERETSRGVARSWREWCMTRGGISATIVQYATGTLCMHPISRLLRPFLPRDVKLFPFLRPVNDHLHKLNNLFQAEVAPDLRFTTSTPGGTNAKEESDKEPAFPSPRIVLPSSTVSTSSSSSSSSSSSFQIVSPSAHSPSTPSLQPSSSYGARKLRLFVWEDISGKSEGRVEREREYDD